MDNFVPPPKTKYYNTYLPLNPEYTFSLSVCRNSSSPSVPRGDITGPGVLTEQYLDHLIYLYCTG